jgi:hypothetical protein
MPTATFTWDNDQEHPVLGATKEQLKAIRARLYDEEFAAVMTVDFNNIAQRSLDYGDYGSALATRTAKRSFIWASACTARRKRSTA